MGKRKYDDRYAENIDVDVYLGPIDAADLTEEPVTARRRRKGAASKAAEGFAEDDLRAELRRKRDKKRHHKIRQARRAQLALEGD